MSLYIYTADSPDSGVMGAEFIVWAPNDQEATAILERELAELDELDLLSRLQSVRLDLDPAESGIVRAVYNRRGVSR